MKITFDQTVIDLTPQGKGYRAIIGDNVVDVEIVRADNGQLELLINNERVTVYVSADGAKRWVTINGQTFVLTKSSGVKRKSSGQDQGSGLVAPMPGVVRSVHVVEGEAVKQGQTLLTVEAMKMEIRIQAPRAGVVKSLTVQVGQTVEREQILIVLE